ncbi:MAG: zinc-dependent metalloprotease [Acidobacteriota bacterium]|nr:zinc-dependent metalloprotease [Acidobacteriota bacterium]
MRNLYSLLSLLLLASLSGVFAGERDAVAKRVIRAYESDAAFQTVMPLLVDNSEAPRFGKKLPVANAQWLQADLHQLSVLADEAPATLRFALPLAGEGLNLDLVRVDVTTADFFAETNDGKEIDYKGGAHYRGIISGREDTMAAVSIFPDQVMGVVKTEEGADMVLGRVKGHAGNLHVFYNTADMSEPMPFSCGAEEPEDYHKEIQQLLDQSSGKAAMVSKQVRVYIECDYEMYTANGSSTTSTLNKATGIFNVVAAIYEDEGIETSVSQTMVWTTPDSYSNTSSLTALTQFRGRSHSADLAHLFSIGGNNLGGRAYLNGLCNSYGYAYSNIYNSYSNLPNYSWTVYVVTHEMGHNLGSPHTQSCSWVGGALDNCYSTEGSCSPGPAPPSSGGTVMSYCHLTSYGIDLTSGFGTQPGNLIRNNVSNASCLQSTGLAAPTLTVQPEWCLGYNSLSWTAVSGATSYEIWMSSSSNPAYAYKYGTTTGTFQFVNVPAQRYVWVKACNSSGCSDFSNRGTARYYSACY